MFAYCGNNSINRADISGHFWLPIILPVVILPLLISGCSSTSTDEVLVISTIDWMESSQKMEKDLSAALRTSTSNTVGVDNESFVEHWNSTNANYVVIHTHCSPTMITDNKDFAFSIANSDQLSVNNNIEYVIITACSVGGTVADGYNMGQMLSTKISPTGYVICSTTTVIGSSTSFSPTGSGQWIVYQNGELIGSSISSKITMKDIAGYIKQYLK